MWRKRVLISGEVGGGGRGVARTWEEAIASIAWTQEVSPDLFVLGLENRGVGGGSVPDDTR